MTQRLVEQLTTSGVPAHLVLDGAIVPNIEDHLQMFGLSGRPLFRETADRDIILAGPWLVEPASEAGDIERCVAAAQAARKGVFWQSDCEANELYKHLRSLNAAKMPDGRILFFRHYDSDVLAAIVPLVDGEQAGKLFGSTRSFTLVGGSGDGASVERPNNLPEPVAGTIAFKTWQIEALDQRQEELSRLKIVRAIQDEFPEKVNGREDTDLYQEVVRYQSECHEMHLTSEWSLAQYVRFNLEFDDRASQNLAWRNRIATELPRDKADYIFQRAMYDLRRSYRQKVLERTRNPGVM